MSRTLETGQPTSSSRRRRVATVAATLAVAGLAAVGSATAASASEGSGEDCHKSWTCFGRDWDFGFSSGGFFTSSWDGYAVSAPLLGFYGGDLWASAPNGRGLECVGSWERTEIVCHEAP